MGMVCVNELSPIRNSCIVCRYQHYRRAKNPNQPLSWPGGAGPVVSSFWCKSGTWQNKRSPFMLQNRNTVKKCVRVSNWRT